MNKKEIKDILRNLYKKIRLLNSEDNYFERFKIKDSIDFYESLYSTLFSEYKEKK